MASGVKVYWELRVVEATGFLGVGFAGTNFRGLWGGEETSWLVWIDDGQRLHGCAGLFLGFSLLLVTLPLCRGRNEPCLDRFLRKGATACVAWDGESGTMLVSADGGPFTEVFAPSLGDPPPTGVCPSGAAGVGLFPVIIGFKGSVAEYSMCGDMHLTPPSPDYRLCSQVSHPPT